MKNILLLLLVFLMTACASDSSPLPPGSPEPEPTRAPSETGAPQGTQAASGVSGLVYSASDVTGIPDTPLENQVVLAMPASAAPELIGAAAPLDPARLRFLKADISEPDPRVTSALSQADGTYSLPLPPGGYVLCLGESEGQPGSYPISVRGCGLASISSGQQSEINFSSGFGEVLLEEQ